MPFTVGETSEEKIPVFKDAGSIFMIWKSAWTARTWRRKQLYLPADKANIPEDLNHDQHSYENPQIPYF